MQSLKKLNSNHIEYEIIRSKRKTISIQVKKDGSVVVRAPQRLSLKSIREFVDENIDWIEKTVQKVNERNQQIEELEHFTVDQVNELKRLAKKRIVPMVAEYAELVGVTYGRVSIRAQKSRWGSCSREGNLNFNCLLMMVPETVLRYVVVHELCHRKEMNHSTRFWAEVEKVIPDYKEQRKWLKKEGNNLIQRLPE